MAQKKLIIFLLLFQILAIIISFVPYSECAKLKKPQRKDKIFKKLNIPEDSTLSLSIQMSRPNILPNFYRGGIVVDAVIETPVWIELNKLMEAYYNETITGNGGGGVEGDIDASIDSPTKSKSSEFTGRSIQSNERCILLEKIQQFLSTFLAIEQNFARGCLLRTICEVKAISTYIPPHVPISLFMELLHLVLSPRFGKLIPEECSQFGEAEIEGEVEGHCAKYASDCPLNIGGILLSNFHPDLIYN